MEILTDAIPIRFATVLVFVLSLAFGFVLLRLRDIGKEYLVLISYDVVDTLS